MKFLWCNFFVIVLLLLKLSCGILCTKKLCGLLLLLLIVSILAMLSDGIH